LTVVEFTTALVVNTGELLNAGFDIFSSLGSNGRIFSRARF